jgi:hypothetical protein
MIRYRPRKSGYRYFIVVWLIATLSALAIWFILSTDNAKHQTGTGEPTLALQRK